LGHNGDDEFETGLKVSKEEREAYLAERAAKKKAQQRAYYLEYRKRPEVVAKRKASEAERAQKKKAINEAERAEKAKSTNGAYDVDRVAESPPLSQQSHELEEVLQVCLLPLVNINLFAINAESGTRC